MSDTSKRADSPSAAQDAALSGKSLKETPSDREELTYKSAGVDIAEGARAVDAIREVVAATARSGVVEELGGFGCLFDAQSFKTMRHPVLVSSTDGVGTKLALAQRLGRNEEVGQDLVAMCADDVVVVGAEPLFFLDYVAVGKLQADAMARIVGGIAKGCELAGCALIGGEMAEHPGVMAKNDYDLAGFCVGVVEKDQMLGPAKVREGDRILGLSSSGIHSNGYSLVRAALTDRMSDAELEEPREDLLGKSLADALLAPTKIYAKQLVAALSAGAPLHAIAHITGGGITENLNRVLPFDLDAEVAWGDGNPAWSVPAIINVVVRAAALSPAEAWKTFNMGVGMALVCAEEDVGCVAQHLDAVGLDSFPMGRVVSGTGKVVYV